MDVCSEDLVEKILSPVLLVTNYSGFPKETPELKFRLRFFFFFFVQPQFAIL